MNDIEKALLECVCAGNIQKAQRQAKILLGCLTADEDQPFCERLLQQLNARDANLIELPFNLQDILIAEDVSNFPENRFVLRPDEGKVVDNILSAFKASVKLAELNISYIPSLMLYGESGGGKTMLARYIAYRADLPFVYVRFSSLVSAYLGSTQANIAKIFEYVRVVPCVLCFDEIDAVGMARGQKNDVGEMNRIVIALMQEMDRLPNHIIVIGTTNRFDRIDPALIRRFVLSHEVKLLQSADVLLLAEMFFHYAGVDTAGWLNAWCRRTFGEAEAASAVITRCTERIVQSIIKESR